MLPSLLLAVLLARPSSLGVRISSLVAGPMSFLLIGIICGAIKRLTSPDGFVSDIPTTILFSALAIEAIYPTLGDDDCLIVADPGPVEPMRP